MTIPARNAISTRRAPPASVGASVDLLGRALARVLPRFDCMQPVQERLRTLWAGVAAARKFGAADVAGNAFTKLAITSVLKADLGAHADEHLRHVIRWGLLDRDPFGRRRDG